MKIITKIETNSIPIEFWKATMENSKNDRALKATSQAAVAHDNNVLHEIGTN